MKVAMKVIRKVVKRHSVSCKVCPSTLYVMQNLSEYIVYQVLDMHDSALWM